MSLNLSLYNNFGPSCSLFERAKVLTLNSASIKFNCIQRCPRPFKHFETVQSINQSIVLNIWSYRYESCGIIQWLVTVKLSCKQTGCHLSAVILACHGLLYIAPKFSSCHWNMRFPVIHRNHLSNINALERWAERKNSLLRLINW